MDLLLQLLSSQLFSFFLKGKSNALVKIFYLIRMRILVLTHAVMQGDAPKNK